MTLVARLQMGRTLACWARGRGQGRLGCRHLSSRAENVNLPVIDISPFLLINGARDTSTIASVEEEREADLVVEQVLSACSGSGFFFVTGHGIPTEHFTSVFNEAAV